MQFPALAKRKGSDLSPWLTQNFILRLFMKPGKKQCLTVSGLKTVKKRNTFGVFFIRSSKLNIGCTLMYKYDKKRNSEVFRSEQFQIRLAEPPQYYELVNLLTISIFLTKILL